MAYATPTADEIQTRFPQFAAVSDDIINELVAEAERRSDDAWNDDDRLAAVKYLTAHFLTIEDVANGGGGASLGEVQSERLEGHLSITYAKGAAVSGWLSDLQRTSYGRRYLELLQVNAGGPMVLV